MANFNRLPDVERETLGWHQPGSKLTRMQGQMHLGIELVQKLEDPHVQLIVVHGSVSVFGHHWIHCYHARICHCHFKTGKRLRENLLFGKTAINFVDVAHFEIAARTPNKPGVGLLGWRAGHLLRAFTH